MCEPFCDSLEGPHFSIHLQAHLASLLLLTWGLKYILTIVFLYNPMYFIWSILQFCKCLFLRERERERGHKWGRDRKRGRQRIWSRLQAWSCQCRTNTGLEPTNHEIMIWAEVGCLTEPPRCPYLKHFKTLLRTRIHRFYQTARKSYITNKMIKDWI